MVSTSPWTWTMPVLRPATLGLPVIPQSRTYTSSYTYTCTSPRPTSNPTSLGPLPGILDTYISRIPDLYQSHACTSTRASPVPVPHQYPQNRVEGALGFFPPQRLEECSYSKAKSCSHTVQVHSNWRAYGLMKVNVRYKLPLPHHDMNPCGNTELVHS